MRILAGDIGGTKSILAIFERAADPPRPAHAGTQPGAVREEKRPPLVGEGTRQSSVREERFESRRFDGLAPMALSFLSGERGSIATACFGIAGPIVGDECRALNLPWTVHRERLAAEIGIPRITLLNDFQAVGHGLGLLRPEDLACLQDGHPQPDGPIALIGAGTGLGEGFLIHEAGRYRVHSSEGGHVDFAPRDETEWRLHRRLSAIHGHVSYERVLSGGGLKDLYAFIIGEGLGERSTRVLREMEASDPAAVITAHALAGDEPACVAALDLFVSIYGAEAGNLALKVMASGGVYVAGGIAPRIIGKLRDGSFIRAFREKGRHSAFLASVPVHVILNDRVGLLGAAAVAEESLQPR